VQATHKGYIWTRKAQKKGEIIEKDNRKVKGRKIVKRKKRLCCYFV